MTMTTTTTTTAPPSAGSLDELEAQTIPFDLYREVHKGLRHALFGLTTAVGSADCRSRHGRARVVERVGAVIALLHTHHGHEDTFIQPMLLAADPTLAAIIDEGHAETEADIIAIEQRTATLAASQGDAAVVAGLDLYRHLAAFTARYLAHMALEEGGVMTALREAMSTEELVAVEMDLRGSVAPPTMCEFIAVMVPAMNPVEREDMLGGMQAGAPPEIFELFRSAAEAALAPADYAFLATRLGLV